MAARALTRGASAELVMRNADQPGDGGPFAPVEPVSGFQRRAKDRRDDVGRLVGVAASCDRVSPDTWCVAPMEGFDRIGVEPA